MLVSFKASGRGTSYRNCHRPKCLNLPESMSELWASGTSDHIWKWCLWCPMASKTSMSDFADIVRITDAGQGHGWSFFEVFKGPGQYHWHHMAAPSCANPQAISSTFGCLVPSCLYCRILNCPLVLALSFLSAVAGYHCLSLPCCSFTVCIQPQETNLLQGKILCLIFVWVLHMCIRRLANHLGP